MEVLQQRYVEEYCKIRPQRTLQWLKAEGFVTLELEFETRVPKELTITVRPAYAVVLGAVSD